MLLVSRAEEAFRSLEEISVVLAPAHAPAGAEGVGDSRFGPHCRQEHLVAAQEIGQRRGVLGRQAIAPAGGLVLDKVACRLVQQPLADVAFDGARRRRQIGRACPVAVGQRLVQAEAIADAGQRGAPERPPIVDCLTDERVQPGLIQSLRFLRVHCHRITPSAGRGRTVK